MKRGRPFRTRATIVAAATLAVVAATTDAAVSRGVSITVLADFGDYDIFATPADVTGTATVSCT